MVKYKWQIYATTGELFTEVGSVIGKQLDQGGSLTPSVYSGLTAEGYNTTDFIPIPAGTRVIRVVCPVTSGSPRYPYICYYTAANEGSVVQKQNYPSASRRYHNEDTNQDVTITVTPGTVDWRVQFACSAAYMIVPASANYFRISIDGQQWGSASVQCYSAYGNTTYGSRLNVNPIYKDDLGISYEIEGKNKFLRRALSGNVTFIGADYDKIMNFGWQLSMRLVLQKSVNGGSFSDYWEGEWQRTDCAITYDDKKIVVTPKVHDYYADILDKYENEYNLIDLAPEIERLLYFQRPVLQIYTYATGEVQNVIGNISFKSDCDDSNVSESDLTNTFRFALVSNTKEIQITNGTISSVNHNYSGSTPYPEIKPTGTDIHYYTFKSTDSEDYFIFSVKQGTDAGVYNFYYDFYDSAGAQVWHLQYINKGWSNIHNLIDILLNDTTTLSDGSDPAGNTANMKCNQIAHTYGRYLTLTDTGNKVADNDPFVDISTNNYSYIYTPNSTQIGSIKSAIVAISRYSKTPTKYGRVEESVESILNTAAGTTGQKYYYLPPNDSGYFTPIMESKWGGVSYWLDASVNVEITALRTLVNLNDAFPLWSCIDKLAKQIDPRLSFKNTTDYSNFLYAATNPVTNQANPYNYLCITQITNVSRGEYTQAAQKGEASLKWFFDLLKNVFNCFWWVGSDYKIHIEHISYFENGGSYTSGTQAVGKDLTALYNPRNGKTWSFGLGECTFETDNVAKRYEFEWSIGATAIFNGNAIEVLSSNIDRKRKEEISVSHFVADMDYIIAAPSEFSNDAWLLMTLHALLHGGYETDLVNVTFGQQSFVAQNGALSFAYLQPRFLTYGMGGSLLSCNGQNVAAASLDRMMTQKVVVPYGDTEIETDKLIRTSVGDGQFKRAVFGLESRCAEVTLKYPMQ